MKLTAAQREALTFIVQASQAVTREELAETINTTPAGASRTASSLVRLGLVEKRKLQHYGSLMGYSPTETGRLTINPAPKDRVTHEELHIPHRSTIERGTELTLHTGAVRGIRGRVTFLRYVEVTNGTARSYAEVMVKGGRSRLIDPAAIKQVHRIKKTVR